MKLQNVLLISLYFIIINSLQSKNQAMKILNSTNDCIGDKLFSDTTRLVENINMMYNHSMPVGNFIMQNCTDKNSGSIYINFLDKNLPEINLNVVNNFLITSSNFSQYVCSNSTKDNFKLEDSKVGKMIDDFKKKEDEERKKLKNEIDDKIKILMFPIEIDKSNIKNNKTNANLPINTKMDIIPFVNKTYKPDNTIDQDNKTSSTPQKSENPTSSQMIKNPTNPYISNNTVAKNISNDDTKTQIKKTESNKTNPSPILEQYPIEPIYEEPTTEKPIAEQIPILTTPEIIPSTVQPNTPCKDCSSSNVEITNSNTKIPETNKIIKKTPDSISNPVNTPDQSKDSNGVQDTEFENLYCIYFDSIEWKHFQMNYEKCKQLNGIYQRIVPIFKLISQTYLPVDCDIGGCVFQILIKMHNYQTEFNIFQDKNGELKSIMIYTLTPALFQIPNYDLMNMSKEDYKDFITVYFYVI
jgi:hypothetical protein